jgi:maltooligosyltrehalose trehalohydrolase
MTSMRVWAPGAGKVELETGGQTLPMKGRANGWWTVEADVEHGADYAYRLDGEGPFPDPRSPWQPHGVHGPSRWVDHERFEWSDTRWQAPPLAAAIMYELHVGTFTPGGTFDSAIERLDYLRDLGVTHVELMPVAEFSGDRGWGYDGVDLYAPHHAYGGPDGLKRFVDACHCRGLAVLLDVVYNHLGPIGNYLGRFGPYFTDRYATPWGEAVNLDGGGSVEPRRFFIDNALMWLRDYHIDGLRLDAVHAIVDTSAYHFLEQLADEVSELEGCLGRRLLLIAESDLNDPRFVRPREAGGYGLRGQWSDDFHHALHAYLTGERDGYYRDFGRLADLAKAIGEGWVYDGRYSVHRQKIHGRPARDLNGRRFVCCLQNHDQIGNRARGDRISALINNDQLKIGAAIVLTAPFAPLLFQGEEWAASAPFQFFTSHEDPELAEAVSKGRREEFAAFGWDPETVPDPQDEATFLRSRLNWDELENEPHASMLEWFRALIALRRGLSDLGRDNLRTVETRFDEQDQWLTVYRGDTAVAVNFASEPQTIPLLGTGLRQVLLVSKPGARADGVHIHLPGQTVAVLGPPGSKS